jgi:type I restriction enzyme, S subunit
MMTGNTHPRLANEDITNLVVPVPLVADQEAIVAEVVRRREEARRLRDEAASEWAAAREEFERQLLG